MKRPSLMPLTTKTNKRLLMGMTRDERLTLLVKVLRRMAGRRSGKVLRCVN